MLDSNVSHRRRSCVVLDLLPASGASPCLLVPKSSRPAGLGGDLAARKEAPPQDGPPISPTALPNCMLRLCGRRRKKKWRRGATHRRGAEKGNSNPGPSRGQDRRTLRNPKPPSRITINLPRGAGWERKRGSPIPTMENIIGDTAEEERKGGNTRNPRDGGKEKKCNATQLHCF